MPTQIKLGKVIGTLDGHPIYDNIEDEFSVRREYQGICTNFRETPPGSIILKPRLLYVPCPG